MVMDREELGPLDWGISEQLEEPKGLEEPDPELLEPGKKRTTSLQERAARFLEKGVTRIIVGPEEITLDAEGKVLSRRVIREEAVEKGAQSLAKLLKPLKTIGIKRGPTELGLRKLLERKLPDDKLAEEPDLLEEFLAHDPMELLTVSGEDVLGPGVLADPFTAPELFGPLSMPQQSQIVESVPIQVSVPGGLQITHLIKDSSGRVGYKLLWQGTAIDWFPDETRKEESDLWGLG